jgi:hypothetical protein
LVRLFLKYALQGDENLNPLLLASLVRHVTFLVLSAFVTRVLYYSTPTWVSELHTKVYRLLSFVCNNYSLAVTGTVGEGCSYRPFASQYCGYRFLGERSSQWIRTKRWLRIG